MDLKSKIQEALDNTNDTALREKIEGILSYDVRADDEDRSEDSESESEERSRLDEYLDNDYTANYLTAEADKKFVVMFERFNDVNYNPELKEQCEVYQCLLDVAHQLAHDITGFYDSSEYYDRQIDSYYTSIRDVREKFAKVMTTYVSLISPHRDLTLLLTVLYNAVVGAELYDGTKEEFNTILRSPTFANYVADKTTASTE